MRVDMSGSIQATFGGVEDLLWNVAVCAKMADPDIKLMGLRVRIKKARSADHWYGWAHPLEDSCMWGRTLVHPAGRVDLGLGDEVSRHDIIRLFAHELRHIGQFHRGRKIYGFLTTGHMKEETVEPDCYEFEEYVVRKFGYSCKGYSKRTYVRRCWHV